MIGKYLIENVPSIHIYIWIHLAELIVEDIQRKLSIKEKLIKREID